jgi:undecaprenyl-diphosphatase
VLGKRVHRLRDMRWGQALILGTAQALALVPGVSRSGATIAAGRVLGFERPAAARYSFLLALPAVFGSGFYELFKSLKTHTHEVFDWPQIGVATVVAGVVGFAVIALFMRYISKGSFLPFVIYRVLLGIALLVVLALGILPAQ